MTGTATLDLSPSRHAQDGIAASDDKSYRWALWRFHDISRPFIVFVTLHPKSLKDTALCEDIDRWMDNWERHADRSTWKSGGYVIVSLFGRVAHSVAELRRIHASGHDIAGPRAADACVVFGRNPACYLVVMAPGIDDALDLRVEHQTLVLDALCGLGKPMGIVARGRLEKWER